VEIFKQVSIDWLAKKWWFFGLSWLLIALGIAGYVMRNGLAYGIDFTGGTVIHIKFKQSPDLDLIRKSLKPETASPPLIQRYGDAADNTVQVRMQSALGAGVDLDTWRREISTLLRRAFDSDHINSKQTDINNVGLDALNKYLLAADPDSLRTQNKTTQEIEAYYQNLAQLLLNYRDKDCGGLIPAMDSLKNVPGASKAVVANLQQFYYAGPFAVPGAESVSPVVGSDLRRRAGLAVGLSFLGMLIYVGFRFKPIYGVAAVIALFHDVAITVGLFALTSKEISLTVIAALLTLVGYSMNDTIVVFDRVRENLRLVRKEPLYRILNLSINQTLARTIMTSGMTFLSVFALFVFGGEVLNGFSFALTIGIIIGTYSSIGIASPIVEWWYRSVEQRSKR